MLETKSAFEDMTDLSEKLGEFAHQINNPLAIIKTKIYLMKKNPQDLERGLDTVARMVDRVESVVKELEECVRQAKNQS